MGRHTWTDLSLWFISYGRVLWRHIHLGLYFNPWNRRNLNWFFWHCASNRIRRVQSSTECSCWVSIPISRISGMWCCIKKYLPQPACAVSFFFFYFLQAPALWILWGYTWEVLFLSPIVQSSPAFREAGQAMLMILISQGAWIQTGILPLQLLLNIWCSSAFPVCLSHSPSFLTFFRHIPLVLHLPNIFFLLPPSSPSFSLALSSFSHLSSCAGK